jgi:hypothetical protein
MASIGPLPIPFYTVSKKSSANYTETGVKEKDHKRMTIEKMRKPI